MALRDKLTERATPYLEPGEQIQSIFLGQSGPSPYWSLLTAWVVILKAGYRTFVVTDRAILILRNGRLVGTRPKGVHLRGPRNVQLGTPTGLWGQIHLDTRYWVHKRFHKDVAAADAALAAMSRGQQYPAGPQQGYPGAGQQQYPAQGQQQYPQQGQQYPQQGQQPQYTHQDQYAQQGQQYPAQNQQQYPQQGQHPQQQYPQQQPYQPPYQQ